MNKLAQIEAMPLILGVVGGVIAFIMASRMGQGIIMKIITTGVTMVVCYGIAWYISNQ
jgi:hypothetical protein